MSDKTDLRKPLMSRRVYYYSRMTSVKCTKQIKRVLATSATNFEYAKLCAARRLLLQL